MISSAPNKYGHIFISYARLDAEDFAKRIYDDLLIEKMNPWLDKRHIRVGVPFDTSIEDAIKGCDVFVLIVSPGSAASDYCQLEFKCATDAKKSLAPIMYIQASPAYLDPKINYIPYDAQDERITLAQLRQAIRSARNVLPQSPEAIRAAEQAATAQTLARPIQTNFGTGKTRKPNQYPPRFSNDFHDRDTERTTIHHSLKSGIRLISIYGQGGVGKSALAVEVLTELEAAPDLASVPDLIVALRETRANARELADRGISVEKIFLDTARALGGDDQAQIEAIWTARIDLPQKCHALINVLGGKRCIVLIDNIEVLQDPTSHELTDPDLITFLETMLPIASNLQVLITSRERVILPRAVRLYEKLIPLTDGLPTDDSIDLLTALDNDSGVRIQNAPRLTLETLVERTKGYPRALEYLAILLNDDPRLTPDKLLTTPALVKAEVTQALADEAFRRLPPDQMRVLEGLALYGRPSSLPALQYLLAPYMDTAQIDAILLKLMESYFVAHNPITDTYAMHPLDLDYCKARILEGTPEDRQPSDTPPYTRYALLDRAAAYFRSIRKPAEEIAQLKTLDALDPQLAEFDYLVTLGDFDTAADVLTDIDQYLLLWGYARRVVELHSSIVDRIADKSLHSTSLNNLGVAYKNLGQVERAIGFYEQKLVIVREIGNRQSEGVTLGNLGIAYANLGQVERAIGYYEQALVIDREIGDRRGEGADLGNLGIAYKNLGQVERAIGYYEQQLVIVREIGDRRGEGNALGNLGIAYRNLGQFERAIDFYEQALVIKREIGDRRGEGNALGNLGSAYDDLEQFERAIGFYEQALVILREIGDRRGEGTALGNLGSAYRTLGQVERAIGFYEQALVIDREIGDRRGEGDDLNNLGVAYEKLEQWDKALALYRQALVIRKEIGNPQSIALTEGNIQDVLGKGAQEGG
ncbi:MAG: tetratricopeptide repeat protein [Chloroflexota bacterium]